MSLTIYPEQLYLLLHYTSSFYGCQIIYSIITCMSSHSVVSDCDPRDWSLPGSCVHGISQARLLKWVAISYTRESSQPVITSGSPTLQADSLPSEPLGKAVCYIRALQFALSHKHQLFLEKCKAVNRSLAHTLEKSAGNLHLRTCPADCVLSPRSRDQLPIRECSRAEILRGCE